MISTAKNVPFGSRKLFCSWARIVSDIGYRSATKDEEQDGTERQRDEVVTLGEPHRDNERGEEPPLRLRLTCDTRNELATSNTVTKTGTQRTHADSHTTADVRTSGYDRVADSRTLRHDSPSIVLSC